MDITIRDAKATDAEPMFTLLPYLADFSVPENRNPEHLWLGDKQIVVNWLNGNATQTFIRVAESEAAILCGLSVVTLRNEMLSHEPSAHLEVLVVHPEYHRQGIASKLLKDTETQAKNRGAQSLTLHVFSNNKRARKLYEKNGFNSEIIRCYKDIIQ